MSTKIIDEQQVNMLIKIEKFPLQLNVVSIIHHTLQQDESLI